MATAPSYAMLSKSSASTHHQLNLQKRDKQMQMLAGPCGDVSMGEWSSEQQRGVGRNAEDRVRTMTRLEQ